MKQCCERIHWAIFECICARLSVYVAIISVYIALSSVNMALLSVYLNTRRAVGNIGGLLLGGVAPKNSMCARCASRDVHVIHCPKKFCYTVACKGVTTHV